MLQTWLAILALEDTADKVVANVESKIQLKTLEVDAFAHHSTPMPKLLAFIDNGGCSTVYRAGASLPRAEFLVRAGRYGARC
jgi:hypothetical protein